MEEKLRSNADKVEESISPRYILETILPIVKDEFIAKCRVDRVGIKMTFCNGQKFRLTVEEIK